MKLLNHTLAYLSIAFLLVIGVWAIVFYINFLDEIYDSIDDGLENSKILIINRIEKDSSLLSKADFLESNYSVREIDFLRAREMRDIYLDSAFYMVNEQDYEPVRILKSAFHAANGKYYELQVFSSLVEEDDLIEDLFYSLVWLYIVLVVSISLINNVLLKKIWTPFYQMLEKLNTFSVERPESLPFLIKTRVTEFNKLNETLSSLLARTVVAFESQKQFIENASHELQTPLAISINKLELLAEMNAGSEAQLKEIGSVIESLERLSRLNKALLLLTKIENKQFTDRSLVNYNELGKKLISEFSDFAQFRSVSVSINHQASLTSETNAELAGVLVSNLLRNAITHNYAGGTVEITIGPSAITIENTGKPSSLNESEIFKRFYKESNLSSSVGLGLAIVKSVADHLRYTIKYSFRDKHVFIVQVTG